MVMSFCAVLFPTGVLDEILNLIESVSEDFPSYSWSKTHGLYRPFPNANVINVQNSKSVTLTFGQHQHPYNVNYYEL